MFLILTKSYCFGTVPLRLNCSSKFEYPRIQSWCKTAGSSTWVKERAKSQSEFRGEAVLISGEGCTTILSKDDSFGGGVVRPFVDHRSTLSTQCFSLIISLRDHSLGLNRAFRLGTRSS